MPRTSVAADERILAATLAGLAQLDPAALTIQSICRASEVTAPTLYYHFGSKDGLLAAAVERLVDDWIELLDLAVPRRGDLDETLDMAEQGWIGMILAPERPLAVLAWVTLLVAEGSERAKEALIRGRERALSMNRDALLPHVDDPQLADDLAALLLGVVVAAALEYDLDGEEAAMRRRLAVVMGTVRTAVASNAATA